MQTFQQIYLTKTNKEIQINFLKHLLEFVQEKKRLHPKCQWMQIMTLKPEIRTTDSQKLNTFKLVRIIHRKFMTSKWT